MENKFESELAVRIAQRRRNPVSRRATLLLMSVVSCAVMIGASAAVLSMKASAAEQGPTTYTDEFSDTSYLVDEEGNVVLWTDPIVVPEDEDILVRKDSTLKSVEFYPPGDPPTVHTKFVYTVNVKLKDLTLFTDGVAGLDVSLLTVDGFDVEPTIISTTVAVNGVPVTVTTTDAEEVETVTPLEMTEYISWAFVAGAATVDVDLPSLEGTNIVGYNDGDMVSIYIMWKIPGHGWDGAVTEVAFPDYQPVSTEAPVA